MRRGRDPTPSVSANQSWRSNWARLSRVNSSWYGNFCALGRLRAAYPHRGSLTGTVGATLGSNELSMLDVSDMGVVRYGIIGCCCTAWWRLAFADQPRYLADAGRQMGRTLSVVAS
jgi:hypothetical protein